VSDPERQQCGQRSAGQDLAILAVMVQVSRSRRRCRAGDRRTARASWAYHLHTVGHPLDQYVPGPAGTASADQPAQQQSGQQAAASAPPVWPTVRPPPRSGSDRNQPARRIPLRPNRSQPERHRPAGRPRAAGGEW
jgi:hypothetical protein